MSDIGRSLYEREVVRRILELREDLVRHDENLAAWHLLDSAVPYFVRDHPEIVAARRDQRAMVLHILKPDQYAAYYATNVHERPFEQQYGLTVEQADTLPRVAYLKQRIAELWPDAEKPLRILDLGANDGWMAAHLGLAYGEAIEVDCVDLHPDNIAGAKARRSAGAPIGRVLQRDACGFSPPRRGYQAVVAFELIEHVPDASLLLQTMRWAVADDGWMFVSTPDGAVEGGNLPNWAHVEPKGHVRALREEDLRELCSTVGTVERVHRGEDRVMVAEVAPG